MQRVIHGFFYLYIRWISRLSFPERASEGGQEGSGVGGGTTSNSSKSGNIGSGSNNNNRDSTIGINGGGSGGGAQTLVSEKVQRER